jgi:hypothetical protein
MFLEIKLKKIRRDMYSSVVSLIRLYNDLRLIIPPKPGESRVKTLDSGSSPE